MIGALFYKQARYKAKVREQFERYARGYDLERLILRRRVEKYGPLLRHLKKGVRVDLGCGTGIYTRELLTPNTKVVGIDFSPGAINIAKRYCPQGSFVLGDLEHLPFKDKCINAFFSFASIYYLPTKAQRKLFKELYRTLAEEGNVLLIEPNAQNIFTFERLRHKLEKHTYPLHGCKVKKLLKAIGFKRVTIRFSGFMPEFVKRKKRKDPIFILFRLLESIVEFLQASRLLGTLLIYAEK